MVDKNIIGFMPDEGQRKKLETLATLENRSLSQMIRLLLWEAIEARKRVVMVHSNGQETIDAKFAQTECQHPVEAIVEEIPPILTYRFLAGK
jgi:hypothetical protein